MDVLVAKGGKTRARGLKKDDVYMQTVFDISLGSKDVFMLWEQTLTSLCLMSHIKRIVMFGACVYICVTNSAFNCF